MTNNVEFLESVHRMARLKMDLGNMTLDESKRWLESLQLQVVIDKSQSHDPVAQATLLTIITLAKRTFLGGVAVVGSFDAPVALRLPVHRSLHAAIVQLGGSIRSDISVDTPSIRLDRAPAGECIGAPINLRAVASGWAAGVLPVSSPSPQTEASYPLVGMLAAALAVAQVFQAVIGDDRAALRPTWLSLWCPGQPHESSTVAAPRLEHLPSELWIIGLGHLGQAFLWALGLLPYQADQSLLLFLQDYDTVTKSTPSTSILSTEADLGSLKTRLVSAWAEARGFKTRIIERRFDGTFSPQKCEPRVAFCGIDNPDGRRDMNVNAFDFIVEAGLGATANDYDSIRLHSFPSPRNPKEIWPKDASSASISPQGRGYDDLVARGTLDQCGLLDFGETAIGAPFVGAVAASLALAEILRILHHGHAHEVINLSLRAVDFIETVTSSEATRAQIPYVPAEVRSRNTGDQT